ncbi:hypothetical protein LTR09_005201 [Extremus antarcticus]|uniref:Ras modification protein ERF4 n=1 Tax=Extremus antarcticus TaxID=702011 RepID=A0AAJ0GCF4_9PEZI|nr:hypothetical protein LTR09_005201 [Extremus antarcticus]
MQTFHHLAGMTETSPSAHDQPSQPIPEAPPISPDAETTSQYASSTKGGYAGSTKGYANSTHGSRVSIPLNRRASRKSIRSTKSAKSANGFRAADAPPLPTSHPQDPGAQGGRASQESAGESEEFIWGPSHPCFPHPNPHCAPGSHEAETTRVIRVRRDWLAAGDLYPQYANLYPEILDPMVTEPEFRLLITTLNSRLKEAFDPFSTRAYVDAVMGVVTGYIWEDIGMTGAKRGWREVERWVEKWNLAREREARGVSVVFGRGTGGMGLDFVIPDPGIDAKDDDAADEREAEEGGGIGPAV